MNKIILINNRGVVLGVFPASIIFDVIHFGDYIYSLFSNSWYVVDSNQHAVPINRDAVDSLIPKEIRMKVDLLL